jgi:signal transduction histidine kinase
VNILYNAAKTDSEKGQCLTAYLEIIRDDSQFLKKALELNSYFKSKNDEVGEDYVQLSTSREFSRTGDFTTALNQSLEILRRFETRRDDYGVMSAHYQVASALYYSGNIEQAILYYKKNVIPMALFAGDKKVLADTYNDIGSDYQLLNMPDSGLIYAQQAVKYSDNINDAKRLSVALGTLAENYICKKEYNIAIPFIKRSFPISKSLGDYYNAGWVLGDLAQIFLETNQHDSARYYARQAGEMASERGFKDQLLRAYEYLYKSFEKTDTKDSVYKYFRLAISTKDSLYSSQKAKEIQAINFREQIRQQEAEQDKIQLENKIRTYAMLAGLVMVLIIALILYRNNQQKQKANKILGTTLTNLKATQSQLIQSEKMASLGELTAGIAHEIQNPLNFVNNFSDVNKELLTEMNEEINKGNLNEVKTIAKDVIENEEKINHHGKRADAIVKGMLQHSRISSGQKEPTDINKLADEYLRLAYHGLRAKDKSFNAKFETDFDRSIGKINILPQEIGRVILNLINNAFYTFSEKQRQISDGYEPVVRVTTKKLTDKVEFRVIDNGNGIPQKILDKIFQPFFTTKPTGQGTGLGLSLSYDIVKAHGGELKVETKEGEGSTFIIQLPIVS